MKILITGAKGQLGHDLEIELIKRGHQLILTDVDTMDITDKNAVFAFVKEAHPDVVIHAAAWTAVDAAEDEGKGKCMLINSVGTQNVADVTASVGAKLMYISTDYVFDGNGTRPWKPDDKVTTPLNVYGLSKYQGELAVENATDKYFIVRISWVFGINGKNFVKTMLNIGKDRKELSVVNDQIGSPTYTKDLSVLLADMIVTEKYGIYHAANEGYCSWFDFAKEIFDKVQHLGHAEYNDVVVKPVSSIEYKTKAKRPFNSRMDKTKLIENGFSLLPSWQDALDRFLKELGY